MAWPIAKLIEKPCRICGTIMECTPRREVCSKCRKEYESRGAKSRRMKRTKY